MEHNTHARRWAIAAFPVRGSSHCLRGSQTLNGALYILGPDDQEAHARNAVFEQSLQQLGWTVGRNLQIDYRLAGGGPDRLRRSAEELVALAPDVITSVASVLIGPPMQTTRTIPIVFSTVADPMGAGFIQSLARPGGNVTGFTNFEYSMSGKWVELLKQIAPTYLVWRCFEIPTWRR